MCSKQAALFLVFFFLASAAKWRDEDEVLQVVRILPSIKTIIMSSGSEPRVVEAEQSSNRVKRSAPTTCRYPAKTNDSEIFCKIYKNRIECKQTCMFGYELKGEKSRTLKCSFKEDEWRPVSKFEKCEKKVDCSLQLDTVGKLVCHTHFIKQGPVCNVKCHAYGDKKETSGTFKCDEKGSWKPKLPHCVKAS